MKPKLLIFEGLDRVGKTTLMKKVWDYRGQIDTCIDRGIISNMVYNVYYGRNIDSQEYYKFLNNNEDTIIIYIWSPYSIRKKRGIDTGEDIGNYDNNEKQEKLFDEYLNIIDLQFDKIKIIKIFNSDYSDLKVLAFNIINQINDTEVIK